MRIVVKLTRDADEWLVDVPDADSDEHAADIALRHANGFHDPIAAVMVEPSNGPAGWKIAALADELPHETEARRAGNPAEGVEPEPGAHANERKPKAEWSRRTYGYKAAT